MFGRRAFIQKAVFGLTAALALYGCKSKTVAFSPDELSNPQTHVQKATVADDELVIVATTDFHATIDKAEGLASVVRALRAKYGQQMLYLDGGDLFQGSLEGNLSKGQAMVRLFNEIGLDAAAIGNHELDYGPQTFARNIPKAGEDPIGNLKARVREARFAWLSANWVSEKTGRPIFKPYAVFNKGPLKACVIGGTTPVTKDITRPDFVRGTKFLPLREAIEPLAKKLRTEEKCSFVLLTVHAGLLCKPQKSGTPDLTSCREEGSAAEVKHLLEEMPAGTLDAVIAGHTHLLGQEVFNGTPVIEAGSNARVVGALHLFEKTKSFEFDSFVEVPANSLQPDISRALAEFRDRAKRVKSKVMGKATDAFLREYHSETALGNFLADALMDGSKTLLAAATGDTTAGVDVVLLNAGGIRADLPEGTIHYGDLYKVLPFDNSIALVDIKGAELTQLFQIAFSGAHGVSAISGMTVKVQRIDPGLSGPWDRDLNGDGKMETWERNVLQEIRDRNGATIDPKRMYRLATVDFLTGGGDHQSFVYTPIPLQRIRRFDSTWIRDIASDYLRKKKSISPQKFYSESKPRVIWVNPSDDKR